MIWRYVFNQGIRIEVIKNLLPLLLSGAVRVDSTMRLGPSSSPPSQRTFGAF
jgi:hypothetical protein